MGNNRKENTVRNIYWGMINRVLSLVFPFIIRTIIIKKLGSEYLGLGSLYTSILQVLSLSELGISSAITYSMYKPVAENDYEKVKALLSFYKTIYRKIGIIILSLGICLLPFLRHLINGDTNVDINIYVLYILYLLNASISYLLFAYKSSVLVATQRNDIESKLTGLVNIGMYLLQILILYLIPNYYIYYAMTPLSAIALNIIRSYIVDKKYPQYIGSAKLNDDEIKEIWSKVKSLIIYKIGGIVSNSADNIIISSFLGLTVLAIYNNYYYIVSALFSILVIYYESMKSGIGNSLVLDSKEKNEDTFNTLMLLQGWIVGWCAICLMCLFQPFMQIWVGKELMFATPVVFLFALYFYVWKIQDIVHTFKEALGFWEKDRFRPLISSVFNLSLNLATVKVLGIYGVIISTILSELLITLPWAPRILYRQYFEKSPKEFYFKLLKYLVITILVGGFTYYCCSLIRFDNIWLILIVRVVFCIFIPNIIYILLLRRQKEFLKTIEWLKSIVKKSR